MTYVHICASIILSTLNRTNNHIKQFCYAIYGDRTEKEKKKLWRCQTGHSVITFEKKIDWNESTSERDRHLIISDDTEYRTARSTLLYSYHKAGTKAHAWPAACPSSDWPDWWAGCLRCLMKRKQIRRQTLLCNITGDLTSDNERDEAWWRLIIITSATTLQSLLSATCGSLAWNKKILKDKLIKIHVWADDLISIRKYLYLF